MQDAGAGGECSSESPWQGFEVGLKRLRSRLLDLTSRNRLLNFRHPEASSLRIVDELPDELFDRLAGGDSMAFLPVPQPPKSARVQAAETDGEAPGGGEAGEKRPPAEVFARSLGFATDFELPVVGDEPTSRKHKDAYIQTLLYPDQLERVLRKISGQAKTATEESGTNMLYLAFGFLDWTESESSTTRRLAPLILMPVLLDKGEVDPKTQTYRYRVSHSGEDITTNVSLREKLKADFGIALPEMEDEELPEAYFARVRAILETKPDWSIHRYVSMSLFQFGKLLLYLDLDEHRWPAGSGLVEHPILRSIFEGAGPTTTSSHSMHDLDDLPEDLQHLPVISDIDSSQTDALLEVVRGRNLVIEGPPGTGKSQTIANLIAIALARGKSVLFVSEKLAALEVVRGRLDAAGLGHLCLELHSHKTQKQAFILDLADRIKRRDEWLASTASRTPVDRRAIEECRQELREVGRLLGRQIPQLNMSAQQVLWWAVRASSLMALPTDPAPALAEDVNAMDRMWRDKAEDAIKLALALAADGAGSESDDDPWRALGVDFASDLPDGDSIRRILADDASATRDVDAVIAEASSRARMSGLKSDLGAQDWVELARIAEAGAGELLFPMQAFGSPTFNLKLRRLLDSRGQAEQLRQRLSHTIPGYTSGKEDSVRRLAVLANSPEYEKLGLLEADRGREIGDASERVGAAARQLAEDLDGGALEKSISGWTFSPADLHVLLALLDVITRRPVDAQQGIGDWLLDERLKDRVRGVLAKREVVVAAEAELSRTVDLALAPDLEQASAALHAIEGAGLLKLLSGDYRKARNVCRAMSRQAGELDDIGMIQLLKRLINLHKQKSEARNVERVDGLADGAQRLLQGNPAAMRRLLDWSDTELQKLRQGRADQLHCARWVVTSHERILKGFDALAGESPRVRTSLDIIDAGLSVLQRYAGAQSGVDAAPRLSKLVEAMDRLKGLARESVSLGADLKIVSGCTLPDLQTALKDAEKLAELEESGAQLLSELRREAPWMNVALDKPAAIDSTSRLVALLKASRLPPQVMEEIARDADAKLWNSLARSASEIRRAWLLHEECRRKSQVIPGLFEQLSTTNLQGQAAALERAAGRREQLSRALERARTRSVIRQLGVRWLLEAIERDGLGEQTWTLMLTTWWAKSWAEALYRECPKLAELQSSRLDLLRQRFAALDKDTIFSNSREVIASCEQREVPEGNARGPKGTHTEMGLLRGEIRKQKRHVPIRTLTSSAAGALKALKPCFMMGPLSVSQYLAQATEQFDILIMDEASQLKPEDAVGAIARAKQVVVVGDPKQLPPTSFFKKAENEEDIDDEEDSGLGDSESILERSAVVFSPNTRLKWHYRSRHESLIAFSNHHFYDKELVLFPAPQEPGREVGLRRHRVQGAFQKGVNVIEADELARFVIEQMKERPGDSLGVVAMNSQQREIVEERIETLAKSDPAVDLYLNRWKDTADPFFVKNLENVQGDERDVIVISFTYGPPSPGGRVPQRFGPINMAGGWRRLNVLFTRARLRIEAFCSLDAEDVEPLAESQTGDGRGKQALREYLRYLQGQGLASEVYGRRAPDSDFEVAVAEVLTQNGYPCVAQLGVAGYFIDIAVQDPGRPGRYLLGIECDGASYHRARCVRDRDRLRQSVLERMGWTIHRVWSTDWYGNRPAAVRRLLAAVEDARKSNSKHIAVEPVVTATTEAPSAPA